MPVQLYCDDNVNFMRKNLKDNSVDLITTSCPYSDIRSYSGHTWSFPDVAHEIKRVLKPGGVCVWIVGDKSKNWCEELGPMRQAIFFSDVVRLGVLDTMIYAKTSVAFPPRKTYAQQFEYIFILCKDGPPTYFNPIMKLNARYGQKNDAVCRKGKDDALTYTGKTFKIKKKGIHSNIFTYGQGFNKSARDKEAFQHSAVAPFELCYDMAKTYSPKPSQKAALRDFVFFEPFNGSGQSILGLLGCHTKGLRHENLIGVDQNSGYVALAEKRLNDPNTLKRNMKAITDRKP